MTTRTQLISFDNEGQQKDRRAWPCNWYIGTVIRKIIRPTKQYERGISVYTCIRIPLCCFYDNSTCKLIKNKINIVHLISL